MNIGLELHQIVSKLEKRKNSVILELNSCPAGHLTYMKSDGKIYLVAETTIDGKRKRHKLTKDVGLAEGLVQRAMLEDELEYTEAQLKLLNKTIDKLPVRSTDDFIKEYMKENPAVSTALIYNVLNKRNASEWARAEYNQSTYHPEEKKHTTSRGLLVRSKSELAIAEKLYEYDIDFRYEQIIFSGNKQFAPDFYIRRKDGKEIIWEHEGLTNDRAYLDRQLEKHKAYAAIGFTPWNNNFIVSYDTTEGEIDLRMVEAEILAKLVV